MSQPKYRISSNGYGGYFVMAWTNSRGYVQIFDTFANVIDAHRFLRARRDQEGN